MNDIAPLLKELIDINRETLIELRKLNANEVDTMTLEEAAKHLKLCTKTVSKLVREGKIRAYRTDQKLMFSRREIKRFLQSRQTG